jgi:beta-glucosidase/6-phospho-beta-glucosidase/beta-galactosidase
MRRAAIAAVLVALACIASPAAAKPGDRAFPRGFLWGVALAGFQAEAGGRPTHADRHSDWWLWAHNRANVAAGRVTGDIPENGPGHWARYREDVDIAAERLHMGAFRLSIEWSRIFPRSTAGVHVGRRITLRDLRRLDRLAAQGAVHHYAAELRRIRAEGMTPFVTLSHFSLPTWAHDPIAARDALAGADPNAPPPTGFGPAGWLDHATVAEFRKYAAYLGWKYGGLVDFWTPVNEPMVVATNGYANIPGVVAGNYPPGAFSFTGAIRVVRNLVRANAVAHDALKSWDRVGRARVGLVQNMIAFTPAKPSKRADRLAARHADYLFNRLFLNAAVLGRTDDDANGRISRSERHPALAHKADFIGVNYYFRGRAAALGGKLTPAIPVLDFLPATAYRTPLAPDAPRCPTTCSDFGSEIYPQGLRDVLRTAGSYKLPVYVTENGIADARDRRRAGYVVRHLLVVQRAIEDRLADVRGYIYWSLTDNLEWSSGFFPKFGLFAFNPKTLARRERPSARLLARIARANRVPAAVVRRYGR